MRKDKTTVERARTLRAEQTAVEAKLWQHLRNRQLNNMKFVRQEPIAPYIVDFVCRAQKLVIEFDGSTHETPEELAHDSARTAFLVEQGYRVIRFRNEDIFGDLQPVLDEIMRHLVQVPPHPPTHLRSRAPTLSPKGEGMRPQLPSHSIAPNGIWLDRVATAEWCF